MNSSKVIGLILVCGSALLTACSTVPDPYIPSRVGAFHAEQSKNDLAVEIQLEQSRALLGDPLSFKVMIKNTGSRAYWIPKRPNLLFYWIYPNGIRDNYVIEFPKEKYYSSSEAVLLKPGEQMVVIERIETFYFPKDGITEFKAMFQSAHNTNAQLTPFWQGTIFSNNFGVMLEKPVRKRLFS